MQFSVAFASCVLLVSSAVASPVLKQNHVRAADSSLPIECTDSHAVFDSSCWDILDIPKYLGNWIVTTRVCAGDDDGSACCKQDEAWSTCFLRLAQGRPGSDCSTINVATCSYTRTLAINLDDSIVSQVRYVVRSIYMVNNLITTAFSGIIHNGLTDPTQAIEAVIGTTQSSINASNYEFAVTAAPALLGNLTSPAATTSPNYFAAKTFFQSLKQAPDVTRELWPAHSSPTDVTEFYQGVLSFLLGTRDPAAFIAFTNNGLYSGAQTVSFDLSGNGFSEAPNTYITTSVLEKSGWYAVPGISYANVQDFQAQNCDDSNSFNPAGFCTSNGVPVYWSDITGRTYIFRHEGKSGGKADPADLLTQVAANDWATLPLMFDGSYNCTAAGRAGGSVLNLETDGSLDMSCLSRLPIYLSCEPKVACPTSVMVNGKCPFGYNGNCA